MLHLRNLFFNLGESISYILDKIVSNCDFALEKKVHAIVGNGWYIEVSPVLGGK